MQCLNGMKRIAGVFAAAALMLNPASPSMADTSISVAIHLGFHVPAYPRLTLVPGYPVYYAPRLELNYFFYDGLYWVYHDDHWYSSYWYDGPWSWVDPLYVPLYILRIPVRYYRRPPVYFYGWRHDAPPRWADRWGHDWDIRRQGWDRWHRQFVPRPAPAPDYQRHYSGSRYPAEGDQQNRIRTENYRYPPREEMSRQQVRRMEEENARRRALPQPEIRQPPWPSRDSRPPQAAENTGPVPERRPQIPAGQAHPEIQDRPSTQPGYERPPRSPGVIEPRQAETPQQAKPAPSGQMERRRQLPAPGQEPNSAHSPADRPAPAQPYRQFH